MEYIKALFNPAYYKHVAGWQRFYSIATAVTSRNIKFHGFYKHCKQIKMFTADIGCCMVGLTVYTEAALFHCPQLLQFLVEQIDRLLHTLPLSHRHLAHTLR